jgi:Ca2+-binding RTX toxin-like protein
MTPVVPRASALHARRLLLLTGCLILGALGLGAVAAQAATPASLAGETFTSNEVPGSTVTGTCGGNLKFAVSGTAAGPFPGTFTESGSLSTSGTGYPNRFSGTFTITSTAGTVTVTGTGTLAPNNVTPVSCFKVGTQNDVSIGNVAMTYTATINGAQRNTGTATFSLLGVFGSEVGSFTQNFASDGGLQGPCQQGGGRRIVGSAGANRLVGTPRPDVIVGGPGNDRIRARGGDDLVCAGPGSDRVDGGPGNDRLFGGPDDDRLFGGPGNDFIDPGSGRDRVAAGGGNDLILSVDLQRDVIECGPGRDVAIIDRVDRTRRCETVIRVPLSRRRQGRAQRSHLR